MRTLILPGYQPPVPKSDQLFYWRWQGHTNSRLQASGTTTLFAALSMLDDKVIGDCMSRHRHQEFIRFLKKIDSETPKDLELHLIVDNYSTHKHPCVKS